MHFAKVGKALYILALLRIFLATLLVIGLVANARAGIITPAGLQVGDQFRVVFVTTTTTTATSMSISYYDNIVVGDAAAAGLVTYNSSPITWEVIGSTDSVSAVSRLPMDNIPIFLPDGTKVATSGAALWNTASGGPGPFLLSPIDETATGAFMTAVTWTGTFPNGNGPPPDALGDATPINGFAGGVGGPNWIDSGPLLPPTDLASLYSFSSILTVQQPSAVPQPATLTLMMAGMVGLVGYHLARRRRQAEARR